MGEIVQAGYQVADAEGMHWHVPYARLEDVTPTVSNPAAVLSRVVGTQVSGTIMSVNATDAMATIDFTPGAIFWQQVRNVLTYGGGVETAWGAINIGDVVYYDRSATMPAGVYLSTSPLDNTGAANPIFGHVVPRNVGVDAALYPKGGAAASTQYCAVMQRGAGV